MLLQESTSDASQDHSKGSHNTIIEGGSQQSEGIQKRQGDKLGHRPSDRTPPAAQAAAHVICRSEDGNRG